MDRIVLTGVHANGTHGVLEFEHERAQPFVVDATLYMDLTAAGASDDLNDTVDYGRAAKEIVAVIEGEHADLIEHLAQRIADRLLTMPPVCQVDVTVHKPHAPITVPFDDVAVSITRMRRNPAGETETESHARQSGRQERPHHAVIAIGGNQGTRLAYCVMQCVASMLWTARKSPVSRRCTAPPHGVWRTALRTFSMPWWRSPPH